MASVNDQKVLAFMFDPFLLDAMNNEEDKSSVQPSDIELTATQAQAKQLEVLAIEQANSKKFEEALSTFGQALTLWPERASIYNNRAQVHRLMNHVEEAKNDLDRAILLSDGEGADRDELVARQAYCQRALIHLLRENKNQGLSDMNKAAEMGNGFAKTYMAKQNPMAALCNQMLQEMFEQYRLPLHHFVSMIDHEKLEARWQLLATEGPKTVGVNSEFNPLKNPPDWYDAERFRKAQLQAKKYYLSLNIAHFIGNILLVHLPDVLIPVLATGHSASPYMVFMRILSTVVHILSWYEEDPFDPNSKTHRSLLTVRRNCHMAVTRMMNSKYPRNDRYWLSQFDMAMTQWSLIGIVAIRPADCAFHGTTKEEFDEYIYFWKVLGYCCGIQDRFNICLDHYEESVEYMDICFQRCYKVHLDRQCEAVKVGMDLTEGVFLGINGITPKWIICFESFMKFWYDSLGVRHPIKLETWDTKLSYRLWIFLIRYLLRIRLVYVSFTWFYLFMLKRLFKYAERVHDYLDEKYGHVVYQLRSDFHIDSNNDNNNSVAEDTAKCQMETKEQPCYQIDNYLYRPQV